MKNTILLFIFALLISLSSCNKKCASPFDTLNRERKYMEQGDSDKMWNLLSNNYRNHFDEWAKNIKKPNNNEKYLRLHSLLKSTKCFDINKLTGKVFYALLFRKASNIINTESTLVIEASNNYKSITKTSTDSCLIYNIRDDSIIGETPLIFENRQWKYDIDNNKDNLILLMLFDYRSKNEEDKKIYFCDF